MIAILKRRRSVTAAGVERLGTGLRVALTGPLFYFCSHATIAPGLRIPLEGDLQPVQEAVRDMTEIVELRPAFRALVSKVRDFQTLISFHVDHLGADVSMLEGGREGALQFVFLLSLRPPGAPGGDVRIVFDSIGEEEVSIVVRAPQGGTRLGTYVRSTLVGSELRDVLDEAIADAVARVVAISARRGRSEAWQQPA